MGPAPKKPDPLPLVPRPGFAHPKFATVGAPEPTGTVRSQIDVSKSIGPALQGALLDVAQPGRIAARAAREYLPSFMSSASGDASRQAASRAAVDTTKNALRTGVADFNQKQQAQAEKSRADDTLAQRQNIQDNFKADTTFQMYGTDILTDFGMKVKELAAYYEREKKNSQAMITAAMMRMLGGLI